MRRWVAMLKSPGGFEPMRDPEDVIYIYRTRAEANAAAMGTFYGSRYGFKIFRAWVR